MYHCRMEACGCWCEALQFPLPPAVGTVRAHDMMEPLTAQVLEEGEMEQSSQPTRDAASVGNNPL